MKLFLRQAIDQGFSTDQSWSLLSQTMAVPPPAKAAAAKRP
jgi:hypothetical protein